MCQNGPLIQVADVSMISRIKIIEDKWGQQVTWHEQEIISDNPTCTTSCRLIYDTAREDRLYSYIDGNYMIAVGIRMMTT